MSLRSLVGVILICSAIIAPWLVSDWLPSAGNQSTEYNSQPIKVTVPGMEPDVRERRDFSIVPPSRNDNSKSKRIIPKGAAKNFATSAKAFLRQGPEPVPQSDVSTRAAAKHTNRVRYEMNRLGMQLGNPVYCRIFKEEHEFELWVQPQGRKEFSLFRVYRLCKNSGKTGPKALNGDGKTPEGFYYVTPSRMVPNSRYHMGFKLGYPNVLDRYHGRSGQDVMVHGKCLGNQSFSLTDESMEEVYTIAAAAFKDGQKFFRIHSFPFRMDDKRMDPKIAEYPLNDPFWANIKEGYDFFEILRFPPNVTMSNDGRYQFSAL